MSQSYWLGTPGPPHPAPCKRTDTTSLCLLNVLLNAESEPERLIFNASNYSAHSQRSGSKYITCRVAITPKEKTRKKRVNFSYHGPCAREMRKRCHGSSGSLYPLSIYLPLLAPEIGCSGCTVDVECMPYRIVKAPSNGGRGSRRGYVLEEAPVRSSSPRLFFHIVSVGDGGSDAFRLPACRVYGGGESSSSESNVKSITSECSDGGTEGA